MIVLLGDYSSVHYELSKALKSKGESVILMSDGDAYKKIGCDIKLPSLRKSRYRLLNNALFAFRFFGFFGFFNYLKVLKKLRNIKDLDVVQIINPVVIESLGALGNILLIRYLKRRAKVFCMCALGDDYKWVAACLNKKYKYSAMDRMSQEGILGLGRYLYMLKYVYSPLYRLLDSYARKKVNVIIPGLSDYEIAYDDCNKAVGLVRLPVSSDNFIPPIKTNYPVKVFHAWQQGKDARKGNDILDRVVRRYISEHGAGKVKYEIIQGVSYEEYLSKYRSADIIFDQIYSYDRGVTGALGMAAGKVVFSGFEGEESLAIGVNAIPDINKLYTSFVSLIESLDNIDTIKSNAYRYAKENYCSLKVADQYLRVWRNYK